MAGFGFSNHHLHGSIDLNINVLHLILTRIPHLPLLKVHFCKNWVSSADLFDNNFQQQLHNSTAQSLFSQYLLENESEHVVFFSGKRQTWNKVSPVSHSKHMKKKAECAIRKLPTHWEHNEIYTDIWAVL